MIYTYLKMNTSYFLVIILLLLVFLYIMDIYEKQKFSEKFPSKNINSVIDSTFNIENVEHQKFIPKVIYRTCNKNYVDKFKLSIEKTGKLMKNYKQIIYFDEDIVEFIKENYPEDVLYLYNKINPQYFPAKTDLFRYLLIYKLGGIYLDIKSSVVKDIDPLIEKYGDKLFAIKGRYSLSTKLIDNFYIEEKLSLNHNWSHFSGTPNGEYNNWFIASPAGNPILKSVILQTLSNITYGLADKNYIYGEISVLAMTGPLMYTRVIVNHENKDDYVLFNPRLDNKLVYKLVNHKKIMGDKHYRKSKNKNVLLD